MLNVLSLKKVFLAGFCAGAALLLTACSTAPEKPGQPVVEDLSKDYPIVNGEVRFKAVTFAEMPATNDADWDNALAAFRLSCEKMGSREMWLTACANAQFVVTGQARAFFENYFDVYKVASAEKPLTTDIGTTTGYYEPMLRGSRIRHGKYQYPIYGVPDDLIQVDLASLYPQLKGLRLRGKVVGRRLVPYDTRSGIMKRSDLREQNVLCWVDDPVEAFFLQIQGSGRVLLDDGAFMRVGFGDQNGHPYKALSNWLIQNAGLTRSEMSMQRIKRWVKENPKRTNELLNTNPNFVFFDERFGFGPEDGPLGAQGVTLTAGASVAVDRRHWPLGLPFVIDVSQKDPELSFTRPVVAQDTGGAIKGVIRFDYFWGYGDLAGAQAGIQTSRTQAWVLLPKGMKPEALK